MDKNNKREAQFDVLFDGAAQRLREFLESGDDIEAKDVAVARICSSTIGAWSRYQIAKQAKETRTFNMAQALSKDRDELERYVRLAMPDSGIVRALPEPQGGTAG